MKKSKQVDITIVGAGFTGVFATHKFTSLGYSVQTLEAGDGIGGTWYWNRYPGARTDSESYVYQYFFSEELLEEWNWKENFQLKRKPKDTLILLPKNSILKNSCGLNQK